MRKEKPSGGAPMTEAHPHWVWDHMPKQCEFLLIKGMSINCLDSFSPSHCKCDHLISPRCWDLSSNSSAKSSDVLDELNQKIEDYQKNKPKLATCAVIILSLVQIWIEELRTKEREV